MRNLINRFVNKGQINHTIMERIEPVINQQEIWPGKQQNFQVRLATEDDMNIFISLEEDAYNGFHAWRLSDFESDWRRNPYIVYLIVETIENPSAVAMISGRFLARGAHISHLVVRKAYQGQGIGSRLLSLWIQLVERDQIPEITLEVRKSNTTAQNLYFKEGFQKVKEIYNYYSDNHESAYFLRKKFNYRGLK